MMKQMRRGIPSIMKAGTKQLSGVQEAVLRNTKACKALGDLTRTSLGPNGMNKMVINQHNKMHVTSDCATIITEMDVEHPAAKMVVLAAQMQEKEIGDGSNFVICFTGALMNQAEELIQKGLHPSQIVAGYTKAGKKASEILEELVVDTLTADDMFKPEKLFRGIFSSISSKQFGNEEFICKLVIDAALTVMPADPKNFNVDNVRVVKIQGGSLDQSEIIRGMVIPRDCEGSVSKVAEAKIAVFNSSIELAETETKGTVLIESAEELMNYNLGEEKHVETIVSGLAKQGVKVIVSGGSVDDIALHFIEKYGMMCVKIPSKFELRRLALATKARPGVNFGDLPTESLGFCSNVFVHEVGSAKVTVFQQEKKDRTAVATILLRSSTMNVLNDVEKAIDDGVNTVKAMGRDGRFVAGAGAVDIELARRLRDIANKASDMEQHALRAFSEALEVLPRTLAENAGLNAIDVIAQLYAAHEKAQAHIGVDVKDGGVKDVVKANILDLLSTRAQAVKLAVDVAVTVLRVDQIIMAKPAGGPKMGNKGGDWDDTD